MANTWLSEMRSNPHLQESETQTAINIVHGVATNIIGPEDAATNISSAYISTLRNNDGHISSWPLWKTVISAIETLGGDTDVLRRLVSMLTHLAKKSAVADDGRVLGPEGGPKFWQDLPGFSFQYWEEGINHVDIEMIQMDRHGATVEDESRKFRNANTFAALYLHELDPNGPQAVFRSMRQIAREHFIYTLEVPFETPKQVQLTEIYIPPAAAYIDIVGPNLYAYCKSNTDYTGENVDPWYFGGEYGGLMIWDKRDGFSLERWAFWKRRLQELSESRLAKDEVKAMAARTAQKMQEIEEADRQ